MSSQSVISWRGFAFENVCFNHIAQIKNALGISGISTTHSAWSDTEEEHSKTQIDLIITRKDNVINLCEMKFYSDDFSVDRKYERVIRNRVTVLNQKTSGKYAIHNTLITTFGIKDNEYRWTFDNVITMDDLFQSIKN